MNKWLLGMLILFVLGTIISGVVESTTFSDTEVDKLQELMEPKFIDFRNPVTAVLTVFSVGSAYIVTLLGALSWDFAFFQGQWQIIRFVFFALTITFIVSFLMTVFGRR